MIGNSIIRFTAIAALALTLTACKSSEERAQEHYESGIALLEEGQTEKALVEFRNVFKLDGQHHDARSTYARIVREQGKTREAYGQYLRLVEQYPEDAEGRIALSEMAFQAGNWDEFDRHSVKAIELAPDDPRTRAIAATADYRAAVLGNDGPAQDAAVEKARALTAELPESPLLRRILIEGYLRANKFSEALTELDKGIELEPDNRNFYNQKLGVLNQLADYAGMETQLKLMIERFPDDNAIKSTLIRFYMSRGQVDEAEAFLRDISDPDAEDPGFYLSLIQFLMQQRGLEAALDELNSAIKAGSSPVLLRTLRASIVFEQGRHDEAVADLEDLLATSEPDDDVSRVRVSLARMFLAMGNEVGARRLVEETLAADPTQVDALKMQAAWQIDADQTDLAIATLRTVLDRSPEDAAAMTLMAEAYARDGNQDLSRDFLSLAVESSGNAPAESIRYARELQKEERYLPAENTLIAALRVAPGNIDILSELSRVYLAMDDLSRTQQIVDTLRRIGSDQAKATADQIEVNLLAKREGPDKAIAYLESLAQGDDASASKIAVIRAHMVSGNPGKALEYARQAVAEDPENATLKFALHTTEAANGDLEAALAGYRGLVQEDPGRDRVWVEISRLLAALGRQDEAQQAIDDGLATSPEAPDLLWGKATFLERAGDIDGAISIYEVLYDKLSGSPVVANNLASLLSSHRDDPESLERAYNAAKRLRNTTVPPFQDTLGWILARRGENEEALTYLEPAARALASDPIVQFHLAKTYEALGRTEDAQARYRAVVQAAGEIDNRPEIEEARAALRATE